MADRSTIRFLRHGEVVELSDVGPNETVLDYLRLRERATGTKEGCCEGDCGACTIALGALKNGQVEYQAVNACIQLLGTIDGKELVTVEDLADADAGVDGNLHPVQDAMVKHHGSQCGFCTPGFVMSLFVLHQQQAKQNAGAPDRHQINQALAGNLCRCTGYRPIVEAAHEACGRQTPARSAGLFSLVSASDDIFIGDKDRFFASPACEDTLAQLRATHRDAVLVAGATDVGLWITKQLRDLPKIIYLGRVAQLAHIDKTAQYLEIGANVTYAEAFAALEEINPEMAAVVGRIGSTQVRAAGTIGGNIANGSPIGDMPPMLIALDSTIELKTRGQSRNMNLAGFFVDYGKQDIADDEYLASVKIPHLGKNQRLHCYKISKRFDQDISAVMAAFRFNLDNGTVSNTRIAFGGMAATPKRATQTEHAVDGLSINDEAGWRRAAQHLADDFSPLSDMRASAGYRLETAMALIIKARAELSGKSQTRIYPVQRDDDHAA